MFSDFRSNEDFINGLSHKSDIKLEQAEQVNGILEETFLVGKENKDKIVAEIVNKLCVDEEKAGSLCNDSMDVLKDSLVEKIKKPFK